jgi:hypothetical protein
VTWLGRLTGAAAVFVLAGCGSAASSARPPGTFPVATPPPSSIPVTHAGRFTLLSMGDTVRVTLADGSVVQMTALGPSFPPSSSAAQVVGTMKIAVTDETGRAGIGVGDFIGTDQHGRAVHLSGGPSRLVLHPGPTGELRLAGVFTTGDAAVSYLPGGKATVTWDFNVELG